MSNDRSLPPFDTRDGGDLFAPERVDETIAARLMADAPDDETTRLVRDLAVAHTLPAGAGDALRLVRAALATAPVAGTRESRPVRLSADGPAQTALPMAPTPERAAPHTRLSATLRALAAVLVVGVVAGGFLAVLRLRAGVPTAGVAWQDRGITAARARGAALDFDPTKGITYAVSDATAGAIYACGANHLWVSEDGGLTYHPFRPALPAGDMQACAIATVPGAPGLFAYLPDPQVPSSASAPYVVGYAMPGAARWQILRVPSTITAYGTSFGVAVAPDQLWTQIVNNGDGDQMRAVGNWLVMLLPAPGQLGWPRYPIGTPDFGRTWTFLDQPLNGQSLMCAALYADPTTPTHLYCAGGPAASPQPADIYETRDGGKTWAATGLAGMLSDPPPITIGPKGPSYRIVSGADTSNIYVHAPSGLLFRHALSGGGWQAITGFTDQIQIAGVASDDSVYTVTRTYLHLQTLRLAAGTTAFAAYGPALALPSPGNAVSFALGDIWPGGQPALYVYGADQPSTQTLWRLALAPLASQTPVDTTPLPTAPAATPATVPACPVDAPADATAIQPGGLGAEISTFAIRWGPAQGAALGTIYYGRYADTGTAKVAVTSPAGNGRVFALAFTPDTALSLSQAQALARTILPADAAEQGQPQTVLLSGTATVVTYECSAAFAAAFPAGTQAVAPLTGSGLIVVSDHLRADGTVERIDLRAYGT